MSTDSQHTGESHPIMGPSARTHDFPLCDLYITAADRDDLTRLDALTQETLEMIDFASRRAGTEDTTGFDVLGALHTQCGEQAAAFTKKAEEVMAQVNHKVSLLEMTVAAVQDCCAGGRGGIKLCGASTIDIWKRTLPSAQTLLSQPLGGPEAYDTSSQATMWPVSQEEKNERLVTPNAVQRLTEASPSTSSLEVEAFYELLSTMSQRLQQDQREGSNAFTDHIRARMSGHPKWSSIFELDADASAEMFFADFKEAMLDPMYNIGEAIEDHKIPGTSHSVTAYDKEGDHMTAGLNQLRQVELGRRGAREPTSTGMATEAVSDDIAGPA